MLNYTLLFFYKKCKPFSRNVVNLHFLIKGIEDIHTTKGYIYNYNEIEKYRAYMDKALKWLEFNVIASNDVSRLET